MRKLSAFAVFIVTSALFACVNFSVTALAQEGDEKRRGPQVGEEGVRGLEFLNFDKKGFLRWRLRGDEVLPERKGSVGFGENEIWVLRGVELQNYSKEGDLIATITSPSCRYWQGEKKASGQEKLSMSGKFFDATGKVWDWSSTGDVDAVRIQQDVRVTLQPAGGLKTPIHILSTQLEVRTQKGETGGGRTEFVFSGKVRVLMTDRNRNPISMESDALVVRLNIGVERMSDFSVTTESANAEKSAPENPVEFVETITATGAVHITSQGRHMYGNSSVYSQASKTFTTLGDARVEDPNHRVRVEGSQIVYDLKNDKIKVESQSGFDFGEVKPVTLHVPSFVPQGDDQPANPDGIAVITGKKLGIDLLPKTNHIELDGDVRVLDSKFDLRSGRLVIETPHDDSFSPENTNLERVNYIIAKDDVRVTYEGKFLRCGQAEIRPEKDLLLLTGNPVMEVPDSGAKLSGHSISLNKKAKRVEVESGEITDANRRRVQVSLPPLKTLTTQRAENKKATPMPDTTITSDRLVMTEETDDVAKFEFTGNIILNGVGMDGTCRKMDILADTKKPQSARAVTRQTSNAALVRSIVATGDVRLSTDNYIAEGGRAEIFPRVALQEHSTSDDNGMDGREPQFITLSPDESTPNVRPKFTIRAVPKLATGDADADKKSDAGMGPVSIESDFQEIISGSERARFFMRGNVLLLGKDLHGQCDTVEGIVLTKQASAGDRLPEFSLQKIIGRKNVHITADGNYARGELLEMNPLEKKLHLSGDPQVRTEGGLRATGGDRIVYDWEKRDWEIEPVPVAPGAPIVQPVIRIPIRGGFKLPDLKTNNNSANQTGK